MPLLHLRSLVDGNGQIRALVEAENSQHHHTARRCDIFSRTTSRLSARRRSSRPLVLDATPQYRCFVPGITFSDATERNEAVYITVRKDVSLLGVRGWLPGVDAQESAEG